MGGRFLGDLRARSLGLVGGKRRRRMFLGALAPIAVLGAVLISNALAIHDVGVFELDRNAQNDANVAGDDWNSLPGSSLIFTGILPDIVSASDPGDQFTGGGSKDDLDVPQWRWKEGEPLDKDDITNAYAAGYTIPAGAPHTGPLDTDNKAGDFVVYFGLDRFDTSGSAQVGFWFLKDDVAQTTTKKNGAFTFSGNHENGDILVQSNFSNGGSVDSVTVFRWNNGSLQQVGTAGDCNPSSGTLENDIACATVNRSSTPSPWSYIPKGASADSDFPTSAFYEGGINLSRLGREPGATGTGCLSTFLAETRSSTPFNAALKDLDLGDFDTCDASVTTQSSTNATNLQPGVNVTDSAVIAGTSLVGGSPPRPTGSVKFYLCKPSELGQNGDCPSGGTLVSTDTTLVDNLPSPPDNDSLAESSGSTASITTAIGKYCWRAEYTPDTDSAPFYSATSHTNSTTECFTVASVPTATTTRQFVYPQDAAKITASAGGTVGGNVTFKLFANFADCSANTNPVHTEVVNGVAGTGSPSTATATTTNYPGVQGVTPYRIDSDTSVWWRVSFVSTNGSQLDSVSDCHLDSNQAQVGEKTTVSFLGNDSSITLP